MMMMILVFNLAFDHGFQYFPQNSLLNLSFFKKNFPNSVQISAKGFFSMIFLTGHKDSSISFVTGQREFRNL